MKNVTDRTSNPFGMSPPCAEPCSPDGPEAVFGYGDANATFHVVGDHPGVHGGRETGVPFTGCEAGERLQAALHDAGLLAEPYSDEPAVSELFVSYLHACCTPGDRAPTDAEYADMERFFDAELRAITADVLVPVGERATSHVLANYSSKARTLDGDLDGAHADEVPGMGFLVVPVRDPGEWTDGDHDRLVERLTELQESGYEQLVDLGRFQPGGDPYLVR